MQTSMENHVAPRLLLLLLCSAPLGSRAAGADASFRSLDGSGNSAANPQSNAVNTPFLARPRYYADGLSSIDAALPNARAVSNALFAQAPFRFNSYSVSSLAAAWGQFVAHDMVMTSAHPNASGADVVRIAVPAGDADMDPDGMYPRQIPATAPNPPANSP